MSAERLHVCPKCGSRKIEMNGAGGQHTYREGRHYYSDGYWCWDCKPRHHFYGPEREQFEHTESKEFCRQCGEAPCLMIWAQRGGAE